jgi:DNA polymerase
MYCDASWLDLVYGDAMDAVAKASRHWITATEGSRIMVGDYHAIEAVILACLAGEQWKIDAFARGEFIYGFMADVIYGYPAGTVTKETHPKEAKDGKTMELAGGYQGWLGAWLKFDNSRRHSDEKIKEFMSAWREKHPKIVWFWHHLEDAAIKAVMQPKQWFPAGGNITFQIKDEWLTMQLPNGKRLWYRDPELRAAMPPWHKPETEALCATGLCKCEPRPQVTYMAWKNKQWKRVNTYGGKLAENATQATCRELLVEAMKRVRAAGYPIVLTVYDEIVCEVLDGTGSTEELRELMEVRPEWAKDWPISVGVWEGARYRK